MSALEQSFRDICEKHDAHYVSIDINLNQSPSARFHACLQWGESGCAQENGATISEALTAVVNQMLVRRGLRTEALADEPLPVEG